MEAEKKIKRVKKITQKSNDVADANRVYLLLANTYFLNNRWNKSITVGYSPETFDTQMLFMNADTGKKIFLSTFEWCGIYVSMQRITKIVQTASNALVEMALGMKKQTDQIRHNLKTSPSVSFIIQADGKDDVEIIMNVARESKVNFNFTFGEWFEFFGLAEFLNNTVNHHRVSSSVVAAYFEQYVEKCIENQYRSLDSSDFFVPQTPWSIANYSRLFHEFPLACTNKIADYVYNNNNNKKNVKKNSNEINV